MSWPRSRFTMGPSAGAEENWFLKIESVLVPWGTSLTAERRLFAFWQKSNFLNILAGLPVCCAVAASIIM